MIKDNEDLKKEIDLLEKRLYNIESFLYESFGHLNNAFKYMDDNWRRCVLQFLVNVNKQLLEEKNGD